MTPSLIIPNGMGTDMGTISLALYVSTFIIRAATKLVCLYFFIAASFPTRKLPRHALVWPVVLYTLSVLAGAFVYRVEDPSTLVSVFAFIFHYVMVIPVLFVFYEKRYWVAITYGTINYILLQSILIQTAEFILFPNSAATFSIQGVNMGDSLINIIWMVVIGLSYKKILFTHSISVFKSMSKISFMLLVFPVLSCTWLLQNSIFNMHHLDDYFADLTQVISVAMSLLVVALIVYMFIAQSKRALSTQNTRIFSKQVDLQVEYYEELEHHHADIRKFRHDHNNLMMCLRALLEANDVQQALQYMDDMGDIVMTDHFQFDTGNYIADALLSAKNQTANRQSTSLSFDGYIPSDRITNYDLCVVLTNAIDNAIEACSHIAGEKVIHILSEIKNGFWFITIKNPVVHDVTIRDNSIPTSKKNFTVHGFGLQNIETIAHKNHGRMQLSCVNHVFTFEAVVRLK